MTGRVGTDRPDPPAVPTGDHLVFLEHPLGPRVVALRTAAEVLRTAALTGAAGFALGVLPLVGLVDEQVYGPGLDRGARAWVGLSVGAAFLGAGALAVVATGAARSATRRRLDDLASRPGATGQVPVAQQRQALRADPRRPVHDAAIAVAVVALALLLGLGAYTVYLAATDDSDAGSLLLATAVVAGVVVLGGLAVLATRGRAAPLTAAAAAWPPDVTVLANRAATASASGGRPEPAGHTRLRSLTGGRVSAAWLALVVAWCVAGFVLVLVRQPGRHAPQVTYGAGTEAVIGTAWRSLLLVGLALLVLGVLGRALGLALDTAELAGLDRRVARADTTPRPAKAALRRALRVPGVVGRGGRGAVVLATVLACAGGAALAADRPHLGLAAVLVAAAGAGLGAALLALDQLGPQRRRNALRAAWPVTDGEDVPGRARPARRAGRSAAR